MLKDLLVKNRSYRIYDDSSKMSHEELLELIELVKFCPATRNAQSLKYLIVNSAEECEKVFPALKWAGFLKDWNGAKEGERPTSYIIQLLDTNILKDCGCDDGIHAHTILLGATEKGYGGCIIKSFSHPVIRTLFDIPEDMQLRLIIAIGKPNETIILEDIKDGDYKYWRDDEDKHHVPKRGMDELVYRG